MAIAETAELIAVLKLKDQLSGPAKTATGSVKGLERSAATASGSLAKTEGGMSRLGRSAGGLSTALGRAKKNIGGLLSGPLGLIGLGVGIAGIGGFFTTAIKKAEEFGDASYRLSKLIGLSVEETSRMVDTLDKFGISGDAQIKTFGLYEKNVGKLVGTTKLATKFQKEYGFSLVDTKGKQVDANEALKRAADYFNSNATSSQKATLLSKLYGKSWQSLIPILAIGRKGIEKEESSALHLSAAQIKQIASLRGAQREFNDTLGDTQTLAGLALLPILTKISRVANSFLQNNQGNIVHFFEDAAKAAEQIGNAINSTVVPAVKAIAGAWNALPGPLRDLLIGGFVANKAVGKIFGVSLVGAGKDLLKGLIGGGGLLGRGNSPASPLYVSAVGGAGGLGGAGGAVGGGKLGSAIGLLGIVGSIVSVVATQQQISSDSSQQATGLQQTQAAWLKKQPSPAELKKGLAAIDHGIADLRSNPLNVLVQGDALDKLESMRTDIKKQIALQTRGTVAPIGANVPALPGHRDERNARTALTVPKLATAVHQGNRGLPQRRDLNDTGFRITNAVRDLHSAAVATERAGFAAVVSVLWAVQAAVVGAAWSFGTAAAAGRGTGADGRPTVARTPRVGIEKNRPGGNLQIKVNTSISPRENTHATTQAARYGPNITGAGGR